MGTPLSQTSRATLSIVPSPPRTTIISTREGISERGEPFILSKEAVSVSRKTSSPLLFSHGRKTFKISAGSVLPALDMIPIFFIYSLNRNIPCCCKYNPIFLFHQYQRLLQACKGLYDRAVCHCHIQQLS